MHGAVGEAEGPRGPRGAVADSALARRGQPRGRHVDRLLEIGPVERIGLVEEGQRLELARRQHSLERDLDAGHEALHQDLRGALAERADLRQRQEGGEPRPRGGEFRRGVRPNHPAARGQVKGLEHARITHGLGRGRRALLDPEGREAGLGHARAREHLPHRELVPGGAHGRHGIRAQPKGLPDGRAHHGGGVVHRHHGRDGISPRVVAHLSHAGRGIGEGKGEQPLRHRFGQGIGLLGGDHEVDLEPARRLHEILRAVGGGRHEQEQTRPGHRQPL